MNEQNNIPESVGLLYGYSTTHKKYTDKLVRLGISGCPNFTLKEFEDPDTGFVKVHPILPRTLQEFRDWLNNAVCASCESFDNTNNFCTLGRDIKKAYYHCDSWKGDGGEHSIHIPDGGACRTWPTHVRIYKEKYGDDYWSQIPIGSKHLIQIPQIKLNYDDSPHFSVDYRIYEYLEKNPSRQWTCVGADFKVKCHDGSWMSGYTLYKKIIEFDRFDYVYQIPETNVCHADMRTAIGA